MWVQALFLSLFVAAGISWCFSYSQIPVHSQSKRAMPDDMPTSETSSFFASTTNILALTTTQSEAFALEGPILIQVYIFDASKWRFHAPVPSRAAPGEQTHKSFRRGLPSGR